MRWLVALALVAGTSAARADEPRHLVYVEALGKGGLYGVGYEYTLAHHLSLGAAGSFAVVSDEQLLTFSPYVHGTIVEGDHHGMFGESGVVLAHSHLPSPVAGWDGMSETGGGVFASLGWQYTKGAFVLRASGSLVVGPGQVQPMVGFAVGARR